MVKTLTVRIDDAEKVESISISGTLDETKFNEVVVLSVGQSKVSLNSQELAKALAEVVKFQSTKPQPEPTLAEKYGV